MCIRESCKTSNSINMKVKPILPVSISIAVVPSGTIYAGTSVTFTATPTNGGTLPTYQWKINGINAGTGTTYTSTTLSNGDAIKAEMTSSEVCVSGNPATLNTITMIVQPPACIVGASQEESKR